MLVKRTVTSRQNKNFQKFNEKDLKWELYMKRGEGGGGRISGGDGRSAEMGKHEILKG